MLRYCRDNPHLIPEIAAALVEEARTRPETVIEQEGKSRTTTVKGQGWATAQKLIWDRMDGPLKQEHEHRGAVVIAFRGLDP